MESYEEETNIEKDNDDDSTTKTDDKNSINRKRNIICCLLISLHNGLAAISSLAVQFFLKDYLKLTPDKMANFKSFLSIPAAIRPILALITDAFPICGYRRKVYLLLSGIVNLVVCLLISSVVHTYAQTAICLFLYRLTFCNFCILCDAILIELSLNSGQQKQEVTKKMMGSFREVRTIGNIISSFLTGYLVENISLRQIFQISSVLPILIIIGGFTFTEVITSPKKKIRNKAVSNKCLKMDSLKDYSETYNPEIEAVILQIKHPKITKDTIHNSLCKKLIRFLTNSHAIIPLLFMLYINSLPAYTEAFFYYMVNEIQLTPSEIGIANSIPLLFTLLVVMVYHKYLKEVNFKTMLIIGIMATYVVAGSILFLIFGFNSFLGISRFHMVIIIQSLESLSDQLLLLPFSLFAVLICPPKLEATIYSICLCAMHFGQVLSQFFGGLLCDYLMITTDNFDNFHLLIIIPKVMSLSVLPILCCISSNYFSPVKFHKQNEQYHDKTSDNEENNSSINENN